MADDFDRTPPHDLAAEQCTLGGMLMSRAAIADVGDILRPADFYRPAHQLIHEVIVSLDDQGKPVDAVTVSDELIRRGQLLQAGGGGYLHTILESVPTAANAGYYARIVLECSVLRQVIEAGTRAVQLAYERGGRTAVEVAEEAARLMDAAAAGGPAAALPTSLEMLTDAVDSLDQPVEARLPTGMRDVDDALEVLPSQFGVIAARTSVGKSLAAMGIAEHVGTDLGLDVVYFSLEMGQRDLMYRRISARSGVPLYNITRHQLAPGDEDRIQRQFTALAESRVVIDDNPIVGLPQIKARIRAMARAGTPPRLVVVDLMGLMQEPPGAESRRVAIDALSRGLKLIAREFAVAIIAVVQVNRGPEARSDKRPLLSDLRESGGIEADADWVVLLHRDDYYDPDSPRAGELDWIIAKQRNGPTCAITLTFQGHYARITGMHKEDTPRTFVTHLAATSTAA
jgi:replicative DNA helicase